MPEEISFSRPWHAAVVQAPLYNVSTDANAREEQLRNARRIAEEGNGRRKVVTFNDLPKQLVKAITVTEDRAFF